MTQDFDYLFAKSKLPKGTIDLSIGESNILRKAVLEAYDLKNISFDLPNIWEYAPPNGYEPLVEILESIYGAKVVVTQSAKHALSGCFYAMKTSGKNKIHYNSPHWPSIPALISREGLEYSQYVDGCDAQIVVAPNNPDGKFDKTIIENIPIIHDAAYYTHSYLNRDNKLDKFGDLQIFSMAKSFGLSGCRLGWIVCNNDKYYDYLTKFVEATTAGVSTVSQRVLLFLLEQEIKNPQIRIDYEDYVRSYIAHNRKYLSKNLNDNIFKLNGSDFDFQIGMFAWMKSNIQDFNSVGVNIMAGKPFGDNSKIRLNLSVDLDLIIKAVNRMNGITW